MEMVQNFNSMKKVKALIGDLSFYMTVINKVYYRLR